VAKDVVFLGGVSMAEVILFHSVLGLRPGVVAAADRLRAAGHAVHAPDLYDGEVFDDLDDGMHKEDALGYQEIARRAREAVAGLPEGLVLAGFSLGAVHAEVLAASRPGALGAVLMHGAVPVEALKEYFGVDRWPAGVPVQVHYAADDPWVEAEEEVVPLGEAVRGAGAAFEAYAYPGSGHLFADPDLPEYDRTSSGAMWERVLVFLDRIDARPSGV
jgi:dienelactone hydrolase